MYTVTTYAIALGGALSLGSGEWGIPGAHTAPPCTAGRQIRPSVVGYPLLFAYWLWLIHHPCLLH